MRRRGLALGVRAGAGVAVAALVLPARTAGARVVAAGLGEVVAPARAGAGLHVRPAVDGRGRILQPLRAARGERGRDRCALAGGSVLAGGSILAARGRAGPPRVGAAAGPAVALRLALAAADAAIAPGRRGTALGTPAVTGRRRGGPGRRGAASVCPAGAALGGCPAGAARGGGAPPERPWAGTPPGHPGRPSRGRRGVRRPRERERERCRLATRPRAACPGREGRSRARLRRATPD